MTLATVSVERRKTPSYRRQIRKDGKDGAFVEIDGRRRHLGAYDSQESREKYHRLIAEWEATGVVAEPVKEMSVVELAAQYLKWARHYYVEDGQPTTEARNIGLALRYLTRLYGTSAVSSFGPKALKTVRQAMVEAGSTRGYINRQVGLIKRMFRWAVEEELVGPSSYHGLQAVRGLVPGRGGARESEAVRPAPYEMVEATKKQLSAALAAMVDMQLLTGARPGEIAIIRPGDIDRTGPVWKFQPYKHKTKYRGRTRTIYIGPKAQTILEPYLLRPAESFCFSPAEVVEKLLQRRHEQRVTPECCGNTIKSNRKIEPKVVAGDHYTTESYRRAVDRACRKAFPLPERLRRQKDGNDKLESRECWQMRLTQEEKLEAKTWRRSHRWHPHQLRHNYGTLVRKQYGLEAAQVLLGHSEADVTQIYAECDIERATEVARKIG